MHYYSSPLYIQNKNCNFVHLSIHTTGINVFDTYGKEQYQWLC